MKVLITPLDWGLGHATRCIPIINSLLNKGCTVSIATSGDALVLLKKEFPQLCFFELPSYDAQYSSGNNQLIKLTFQVLKFLRVIKKEHRQLQQILQTHTFDLILSDNRYGCYAKQVKSIFITHQLNLIFTNSLQWVVPWLRNRNNTLIKKFNVCWIPDTTTRQFSGNLSLPQSISIPVVFVGTLSRFPNVHNNVKLSSHQHIDFNYQVLAIISGPEPQRSIFEKIMINQFKHVRVKSLLVRGVPSVDDGKLIDTDWGQQVSHLSTTQLEQAIRHAQFIICRSGYSSIMDLAAIGKKNIVFVPTPGQIEQEYLAEKLYKEKRVYRVSQSNFNLNEAMIQAECFEGLFTESHFQYKIEQVIDDCILKT